MSWPRYDSHRPSVLAEPQPARPADGSRRWPADLAYGTGLAIGVALLALFGSLQVWLDLIGANDFSKIWAGPRALLIGADPYDPATWYATAVRLGTAPPDTSVYLYPPWVTLLLIPFGALPLVTATITWTLGGLVAAIVALRALLRSELPDDPWAHGVAAFLLVFSPAGFVTLITGQWTFLLLAALAATILLLRRGRLTAAGLVAVFVLAKPQLFVFTAPALALAASWPALGAARGDRRFLSAAVGLGALIIALAWAFIPSWWPAWIIGVGQAQIEVDPITLPTALRALLGVAGVWLAAAVLVGAVAVALRFDPRGDGWLPVWLALSSAATVYSNTYDLLLLLIPLVLGAGAVARGPSWRPGAVLIVGGLILGVGMAYLHQGEGLRFAGLVPLAIFVLLVGVLWVGPARAARGSSGLPPAA